MFRKVAFFLPLWFAAATAHAQSNTVRDFTRVQVRAFSPMGQSFTAEYSGLQGIGFAFSAFNSLSPVVPVTVNLLSGDGLSGALIASREITPVDWLGNVNQFSFADFTGVNLTVGAMYTATLATSNNYWAVDLNIDGYRGGSGHFTNGEGSIAPGSDLLFRVTSSTEVPEPTTASLLAIGLVSAVIGAGRRRARVVR